MTIVKVQRALMPPDQTECLVYDEQKIHLSHNPSQIPLWMR